MKKLLAILLALVMVLSMAACTPGDEEGTKESKSPETIDKSLYEVTEAVTITFWHNYSNEARAAFLEDVAKKFHDENPLITVEVVYIGNYPVIAEQVSGAIAAGQGLPALSTINVPRAQVYAHNGVSESLDNYFKAMDMEADLDDYFDGIMETLTYDGDGQLYGMPFGISSGICLYNQTLLESINEPFPSTWEEFKGWCKRVHEKTGKVAFAFPFDFNFMNNFFLNVAGVDPLGNGKESALADEKVISFVKELKALVDAGYCSWVGEKVNSASDDLHLGFKAEQIVAYSDTSTGALQGIQCGLNEDGSTKFKVGTAVGVSNTGKDPVTTVSGASLVIYADNDQQIKNAAFQFAVYLTNAENNAKWVVDTQMYPTRKSVVAGGALDELYKQHPELKNIFDNSTALISKNKVSCMQECMETVVSVLGQYLNGGFPASEFEARWTNLKEEVDDILADVQ